MTALVEGDLASAYRQAYRAGFRAELAAGTKGPFLVPLYFLATHALPALYLALPHRRRPRLYRARWLVLALCAAGELRMARHVSSVNFAAAYGAGLIAAWGFIWNCTLLLWTRPQWDAKRVQRLSVAQYRQRRQRQQQQRQQMAPGAASENGKARGHTNGHAATNGHATDGHSVTNGHANNRHVPTNGHTTDGQAAGNGHAAANGYASTTNGLRNRSSNNSTLKKGDESPALDHAVSGGSENAEEGFVYVWQEYPEDESFLTRLSWALDIATSMRLTGWNWAIRVLPPYEPPAWEGDGSRQKPLHSLPDTSREGFTRARTRWELVRERFLVYMLPSYLILDFCAVYMTQDPYFVAGPAHAEALPPALAALPPALLALRRTALSFAGVLSALWLCWNLGALGLAFLGPPVLGFRADPWHLPSMSGSFTNVLDRGLAGFWGAWWHQTFRFGFAAPTAWLVRRGYLTAGSPAASLVGACVAFLQSGFLHGAASYTTVPPTKPWEPALFFLLSGVGGQLQYTLARTFRGPIAQLPRWLRRLSNLVFVFVWLHLTGPFLLDDFGRCGLWLWEPVPFSVIRWAGFGLKGDAWWRWDRDHFPHWYTGKHWWETGWGL